MSLVVALLMMFVSDVLSQADPSNIPCNTAPVTPDAEANAVEALYTGWGILSAMRGTEECLDPCYCGWEGVICVTLEELPGEFDSCSMYSVIGL
jgi:hypothetical protein